MIIAKTDDMICQTPLKSITGLGDSFPVIFDRVKDIELNIVRKITQQDYVIAVLGALGMFMAFYFTVFMISCCLCIKEWHMGSLDEDRRPIISSIEVQDVGKDFDTHFPSLNTQFCIKGLLVVRDFCFWAIWAAGPVHKKIGGRL